MTTLSSFTVVRRALQAVLLSVLLPVSLRAQMGNDNPTGVSGVYNGNVTSGGSYDPYTGNATRSITDITVSGAVGAYPLAFTRTMNSRYTSGTGGDEFGPSGNWRHSYQWSIEPLVHTSNAANASVFLPDVYTVNYPDGRRLSFSQSNNDTRFRAGSGVSDRFQQLANSNGGPCYLLLPDGGKVVFEATVDRLEISEVTHLVMSTFTYQLVAIIDPHGETTTISYPGDGSETITEPAGRWLKFFYIQTPWNGDAVIDRVVASDGRSVKYNYGGWQPAGTTTYTYLANAQYLDPNGVSYAQAIYAYQQDNTTPNGRPLILWAIDPMYSGRMWAISYSFVAGSSVYGQLQSENYLDPATGTPGQVVSSLSGTGNSRTETRGDGPSRTFTYSGGKLVSSTDFKGQPSFISYDGNGFISGFTDERGKTTSYQREGLIGALSILTHPDTEHSTQGFSYATSNDAPYYLQIRGDERGHNTYFSRDPNNFQLTRIDYPDYPNGAYETFGYNGFGQVTTHRMTSGGTETHYYDGRGMMWAQANPDGTAYFYYDSLDRLEHVVDRRGKTTWFQYNPRGQVTRVTRIDGSYTQYGYNVDGTLAWTADENHPGAETDANQRTRYAYDYYKRVVSVTNPLNQTTSFVYAQDWANPYNQTTTSVKGAFSPMGKQVHYAYDENWQRTIMRVPPTNDPNSDSNDAWTFYGYDPAGNLTWVQDPRTAVTTFGYDERNRRTSTTNALNQTTTWQYDPTSNVTRETRPDQSYRQAYYDSMNRVYQTVGFMGEGTGFGRDLAGNVIQTTDAKGANYYFGYDLLNRKTSATYPTDATGATRTETWRFDAAGNIDLYKNPASQYRHLLYDDRNRLYDAWWDNGVAPEVVVGYDFASRVTSIVTNTTQTAAETSLSFHYDDANRMLWEDQTVSGHETHRLQHDRDADGNPTNTHVPGMFLVWYNYNQRNQLAHIYGGAWDPWFIYSYDAAGNMTKRQDVLAGVNDSVNAPSAYYDPLNRPTMWENTGNGDNAYARSWYQYDNLGREVATWRDEQSGKGERFGYDPAGQLRDVSYNADQVSTGNPVNATRTVNYDTDVLNRNAVTSNGTATNYSHNAMNQYTLWGGQSFLYDGNFNFSWMGGWQHNYDSQNHLTSVSNGGGTQESFVYDGLGRCVKRTVNGAAMIYVYDGWKAVFEHAFDGAWMAYNVYGPGSDEILWRYHSQVGHLRYHTDIHGNVSELLGWGGEGLEKYTYDAFGIPTVTNWDGSNPRSYSTYGNRFMFQGREWYSELGYYNFRHRFYDPTVGRFLQKDPLGFGGGDANLYRYCGGDPVNRRDPFGLVTSDELKRTEDGADQAANNAVPGYLDHGYGTGEHNGVEAFIGTPTGSSPGDNYNGRGGGPGTIALGPGGNVSSGTHGRGDGTGRGAGGGRARSGSGTTGSPSSPQFSGNITVNWWPEILTLPYTKPPTPEQAAWTDTGRVPTLIAAGIFALPALAPETGLYASAALYNSVETATMTAIGAGIVGYQTMMANPQFINGVQQFAGAFTPGMGGATSSWYGLAGWWTGQLWRNYDKGH
jgi:RHS repeat-associated protein